MIYKISADYSNGDYAVYYAATIESCRTKVLLLLAEYLNVVSDNEVSIINFSVDYVEAYDD